MKKQIFIPLAIIILAVTTFISYQLFGSSQLAGLHSPILYSPPKSGTSTVDTTGPKTEECPINGEMLTKSQRDAWEKRRPLVVMIENHPDARPQSGLTSADVIYEAVAEGGITRFATVFYCKDSDGYVGPVRSARVYFIDFASEYGDNPLYTHVGGANCNSSTGSGCGDGAPADALGKLETLGWTGYNDLNFIPFPDMWRDYDRLPGVATEHTVYSTTAKLWAYAQKNRDLTNVDKDGVSWDKNFQPWKFKDDQPASAPLTKISFEFWKGMTDFDVTWQYDKTTNSFMRSEGGKPHVDKNNGKQITSKNVIVAFMDESDAHDGYDAGQHLLYDTTAGGDSIVFEDGKAIKGTWKKPEPTSHIRFYDSNGKEISLDKGQTFIEILPTGNTVNY